MARRGFGRGCRGADCLSPSLAHPALAFEHRLVLCQQLADIQLWPFHQALDALGIVMVFRVLDAITHQQVVFLRDEEARLSGVALPPGAAA